MTRTLPNSAELLLGRAGFAHSGRWRAIPCFLALACLATAAVSPNLFAAKFIEFDDLPATSSPTNSAAAEPKDATPHFAVRDYVVEGTPLLSQTNLAAIFSHHTGTNVSVEEIAKAASELQSEYRRQGSPDVSVALAPDQVTDGIVTLHVFEAPVPQIWVSGVRFTNAVPAATNALPKLAIRAYEITGDTLLTDKTLTDVLLKYTGTNMTVAGIFKAREDLQTEYWDRGFPTVKVVVPPQQIGTNGVVKIRVFEGRLAAIEVVNNHYFSSNNIVRALPSLHANQILRGPISQAELDRANANQDRQISAVIEPGPVENTSALVLRVQDRLPLHGKVEFNNQNSPGTPDLRLNVSAAYNNLWQYEHSLGLQYSFSPEAYKAGEQWAFYDRPLVANYSGFYRIPLGSPAAVESVVATKSGSFGYNEATRKFNLPSPSGRPELNIYASRSTIDTGLGTTFSTNILDQPGVRTVTERDVQQDVTINQDIGFRLSDPLPEIPNWRSMSSAGLDYKTYDLTSYKTNNFLFTEYFPQTDGTVRVRNFTLPSGRAPTHQQLDYLPFSFHWDASLPDSAGGTVFGLGLGANLWYSGNYDNLQRVVGTTNADAPGHWVVINPSLSRDFTIRTNWMLSLHAEGQWASGPLISNEQYGAGGVASVRGYHEGEVFGDTGWRVNCELKTPPHVVGIAYSREALTIRGSIYTDYAETYLLDPQGRDGRVPIWGAGFGWVASVGSHWEARFLFSVPLLGTISTEIYQPKFNFALTAQF